jgi:hypothetical protein
MASSTVQSESEQPCEMMASLTWHFSIFAGGRKRGEV